MDLELLINSIKNDTSIIFPPEKHLQNTGNVDSNSFIEIGCIGLSLLVKYGLESYHTILDVGCGVGRVAIPLLYYLSTEGKYFGFDPVSEAVIWCKENIEKNHSNFIFDFIDVFNILYNPQGSIMIENLQFPYTKESFDFMLFFSVFTHLASTSEIAAYLDKIVEFLKPNGRVVSTWFLVDEEAEELIQKNEVGELLALREGILYATHNNAAMGYDQTYILNEFNKRNLKVVDIIYGDWAKRKKSTTGYYQDLIVIEK